MKDKKTIGIVAGIVSAVVYIICTFSEHGSITVKKMNNKKNLGIVAAVVSTVVYLICTFSEHGSIP